MPHCVRCSSPTSHVEGVLGAASPLLERVDCMQGEHLILHVHTYGSPTTAASPSYLSIMALPSVSRPVLLQPLSQLRLDESLAATLTAPSSATTSDEIDPLHRDHDTPRFPADPESTDRSFESTNETSPKVYVAQESQYITNTAQARKPLELSLVGSHDDQAYWEEMALTQAVTRSHLQPPMSSLSQIRGSLPSLPNWPTSPIRSGLDGSQWKVQAQAPPKSLQLLVSQDLAFRLLSVGQAVDEMDHVRQIHLMLILKQQLPSSPPASILLESPRTTRLPLILQVSSPGLGSRRASLGLVTLITTKRALSVGSPTASKRALKKELTSLNFPRRRRASTLLPTPATSIDLSVTHALVNNKPFQKSKVKSETDGDYQPATIPIPTTPKKRLRRSSPASINQPSAAKAKLKVTKIPFYPRQLSFQNQWPHSFPITIHYTQKRPRKSRAEGCWTCRLRKKTCPRDGPVCHTCARLNLACDYLEVRPVYMDVPGARAAKLAEIRLVTDHKKVEHLREIHR